MGTGGSGVPGPTLFLLMVLPPSLMGKKSLLHSIPGPRDSHHPNLSWGSPQSPLSQGRGSSHHRLSLGAWQEKHAKEKSCQSSKDVYFLLDMSGGVSDNWMHIYDLVAEMVENFESPKLRMSFITYSTQGRTIMKLTSDRTEIHDGLIKLQNVAPSGATHMEEGLKLANEQIAKENSRDHRGPAVIIAVTDGRLLPTQMEDVKREANRARRLGATIYVVGVSGYGRSQLLEIAGGADHVFGVETGFRDLRKIVEPPTSRSCVEITRVQPSSFCAKENYEVKVSGKGFKNAKNKNTVICRFKFSKKKFFDKRATSVKDTNLMCPGVKTEHPNQEVFIGVSLNNGLSFVNNELRITSEDCGTKSNATRATTSPAWPPGPQPAPPMARPPAAPPPWPPVQPHAPPPAHSPLRPRAFPPLPPTRPPAPPPAQAHALPPDPPLGRRSDLPSDEDYTPSPASQFISFVPSVYFFTLIPALLILPLLGYCFWWLCCKRIFKESRVQNSEKEAETCHMRTCPTVIVPCSGCQVGQIRRMEGKLDILCDIVQRCNQGPLMCCQPVDKKRCANFTLMKPYLRQMPCSLPVPGYYSVCQHQPHMCPQPPSRMLPLVVPPSQALCRTTFSLPPP